MSRAILDRIHGALMGIAVGDALGMPVEMWTPEQIRGHFGKVTRFEDAPTENILTGGLPRGHITDDTQQTMIIANLLIEGKGSLDPTEVGKRLMEWARNGQGQPGVILGPSSTRAFDLIARGVPITETGRLGNTNGGAMRIAPVGIISDWKDLKGLVQKAYQVCIPTHNTQNAVSGAAAIAAAYAYGIDGNSDLKELMGVAEEASRIGQTLGYPGAGPSVPEKIGLARGLLEQEAPETVLAQLPVQIGTGLLSSESVPTALALVVLAEGDPWRCAKLAANLGGDTDTIAAMSTGICGAMRGIAAFPEDVQQMVIKTNNIDFLQTAQGLLSVRASLL